jgi:cell wall-associated NlpC family hydrolase
VVAGLVGALPATAPAAPIDDLRVKAAALEAQIAETGARVAALGEQLNAAQLALDDAQAKIVDAETRIAASKAESAQLIGLVRDRMASIYRRHGIGPTQSLDFSSASNANIRSQYAEVATRRDNRLLDQLDAVRKDLAVQRSDASRARAEAQTQRDALASTKAEADAAAAEEQSLLGQVQGELGVLVREEQARREAAAAAAAPKPIGDGKPWTGPVPDPSGGAGAAVAFALAQVGKPYQYAATGPDTYDCSGLTMRAWQAGGISLPHYSGAQARMFPPVPLDQLQPGDLITTSSWSAHVGIWVGGGYVHATHTGDVIRHVAGSGSVRAAVRPG